MTSAGAPVPPPTTPVATTTTSKPQGTVTVAGAIAIGVGGMMGAGIYTLLGLASTIAGVWIPIAFVVGGAVSAFSVYSYAKLGARYPSRGGAGEFLVRCFGDGLIAGGLNVFQFLGWIIAMALYSVGFGGYAAGFIPGAPDWAPKAFGLGLVVVIVLVNMVGSGLVAKSELVVVSVELVILAVFVGFAAGHVDPAVFSKAADAPAGIDVLGILFAAGLLYVTYEGFGVVTNSAGNMKNPAKQLPKAMYVSLAIVVVVYVVISGLVVMMMSLPDMDKTQGHVLAEAASHAMGPIGFVVLGAAAMLATASGVNATLFGDANLSYMMATKGEIPADFQRGIWRGGKVGLFVAAGLTMVFVAVFPLSAVGQMASLAFLLIYGAVSLGHLRLRRETGAKAWLLIVAVVLNFALFALLLGYTIAQGQVGTWVTLLAVLLVAFGFEYFYRRATGRKMVAAAV